METLKYLYRGNSSQPYDYHLSTLLSAQATSSLYPFRVYVENLAIIRRVANGFDGSGKSPGMLWRQVLARVKRVDKSRDTLEMARARKALDACGDVLK